jgi:DNA-binding transcriptional ArsR family regulator
MTAAATLTALAEPNRRAVLDLLRQRPRSVNELVEALELPQPTTSKHLQVLRSAGLVQVERAAQRRIYSINPAPFGELDAWLAPYRALWTEALDRLADHLDATAAAAASAGDKS